jgi:dipeptidyl aminopeptidase/acylaminoacyl peptidase
MAIADRRRVQRTSILVLLIAVLGSADVAFADRLAGAHEVAHGGYYGPRFAPDGRQLLVTGVRLRGLYLAPLSGGAVRRLSDEEGAGVHARFRPDGAIEYRAMRVGQRRDLIVGQDGAVRGVSALAAPVAQAVDERIYVRAAAGAWREVGSGDRFFAPLVSPDGGKVAFQGLTTGIYIHDRSSGATVHVGPGTAPAWSPDGSRLVYEVTEDDGHEIVASELHLYDLASRRDRRLTVTEDRIERRPGFSPDGQQIAFDDDTGRIWIARLEVER